MRLIDADELRWTTLEDGFGRINTDIVFESDINAMPEVDAIPVGWIEEQIRESYDASKEYDGCYDYAWALSELVKRWREKNGAVD